MGDNSIINGLWIGNELSVIEMLTLHSFVANGHQFNLWVYDELKNELPPNVVLKDANEILPRSSVFRYKNLNQYGHGKGSVSGFSDVFRYKLLYEKGGWWVDMDVTCLKSFNIDTDYFFRNHHDLDIVGNVIKCPVKSELMRRCYNEAAATVDEHNIDWHKPIKILNNNVNALELLEYIHTDYGNHDQWHVVKKYVYGNKKIPSNYFFIHWLNEEWRSRAIDKGDIAYRSTLGQLLLKYGLINKPADTLAKVSHHLRHLAGNPLIYSRALLNY